MKTLHKIKVYTVKTANIFQLLEHLWQSFFGSAAATCGLHAQSHKLLQERKTQNPKPVTTKLFHNQLHCEASCFI